MTECIRLLDLSDSSEPARPTPPLLGLSPELLTGLTKPAVSPQIHRCVENCDRRVREEAVVFDLEQNIERMKGGAAAELEKHLKKKCLSLLAYHQPESGTLSTLITAPQAQVHWLADSLTTTLSLHVPECESESLRLSRLSHLSAQLDQEQSRAQSLQDACRHNSLVLQKQTDLYLSVSVACCSERL